MAARTDRSKPSTWAPASSWARSPSPATMASSSGMCSAPWSTVVRLADDHYFLTTTTGNAATVLEWFEEWHQTEWPHLDVTFTSLTEQWSTVAVVGPRSREVVAALAPALDCSAEAFGFMAVRETCSRTARRPGSRECRSPASSRSRSTSAAGTGSRSGTR